MFKVAPTNVEAPLVPVVVKVIVGCKELVATPLSVKMLFVILAIAIV
jgi:hypothetical protein